jgi:hypothetical protein
MEIASYTSLAHASGFQMLCKSYFETACNNSIAPIFRPLHHHSGQLFHDGFGGQIEAGQSLFFFF